MKKKTALSFLGLGLIGMVAVPGFGLSKAKAADQDVVCLTCHTPQGVTSLFSLPAMMVLMQREGRHPQVDSNMGNTPTQCMQACHNGSPHQSSLKFSIKDTFWEKTTTLSCSTAAAARIATASSRMGR